MDILKVRCFLNAWRSTADKGYALQFITPELTNDVVGEFNGLQKRPVLMIVGDEALMRDLLDVIEKAKELRDLTVSETNIPEQEENW